MGIDAMLQETAWHRSPISPKARSMHAFISSGLSTLALGEKSEN